MLQRLNRAIKHARHAIPVLGLEWFLREKYLRRAGIEEVEFRPEKLDHPVYCRVNSSDIYEYTHLLGRGREPFGVPNTPRIIVDAGSNVGYSVLRFQSDYPGATIIGIEPEANNVRQFKKNCAPYSNISIEHAALWSSTTRLRIKNLSASTNGFQVIDDRDGDVEAVSIEEVMRRHNIPHIDLLKIDIEGSEMVVFSDPSAKRWLNLVGMLLIETHERYAPGCTDAINSAMGDAFEFRGVVGEYHFYISRRLFNS